MNWYKKTQVMVGPDTVQTPELESPLTPQPQQPQQPQQPDPDALFAELFAKLKTKNYELCIEIERSPEKMAELRADPQKILALINNPEKAHQMLGALKQIRLSGQQKTFGELLMEAGIETVTNAAFGLAHGILDIL